MLHGCICRYATSNTRAGIESCGILAGSLREKQGVFVISTLIIPKQEGTSDTVQALNEEEIFDVQDKRALYPLGWIHTHPTQTCFLSSVDVHTQCGYQVGLRVLGKIHIYIGYLQNVDGASISLCWYHSHCIWCMQACMQAVQHAGALQLIATLLQLSAVLCAWLLQGDACR